MLDWILRRINICRKVNTQKKLMQIGMAVPTKPLGTGIDWVGHWCNHMTVKKVMQGCLITLLPTRPILVEISQLFRFLNCSCGHERNDKRFSSLATSCKFLTKWSCQWRYPFGLSLFLWFLALPSLFFSTIFIMVLYLLSICMNFFSFTCSHQFRPQLMQLIVS